MGRISRRQSWILLKYFFDLVSGGVSVTTDKPKAMKQHIFPQKIGMYAQTKFTRALDNSIASSIAEKIHVSRRHARNETLYLVKEIMNSNVGDAAQLAYWLELDDNQIKSLLDNPQSLRKIKQVMSAMEEERIKKQTEMGELQFSSFDRPGDDWTDILKDWEEKKVIMLEEEKRRKEEEKKRKVAERKKKAAEKRAAKKAAAKKAKEEKEEKIVEEEPEEENQTSLDQFF